jgi:hypothetical protein
VKGQRVLRSQRVFIEVENFADDVAAQSLCPQHLDDLPIGHGWGPVAVGFSPGFFMCSSYHTQKTTRSARMDTMAVIAFDRQKVKSLPPVLWALSC